MNPVLSKLHTIYNELLDLERILTEQVAKGELSVTCLDCCNWTKELQTCKLYGTVPPNVIAEPFGKCDKLDFIPF